MGLLIGSVSLFQDKQLLIPDEAIGKDAQSIAALQRRLTTFEHELVNLGAQVLKTYD